MKLGIDIGGTFTDLVLFDPNADGLRFAKTLTTYPDPTIGIHNGIKDLQDKFGLAISDLESIIHGTTLITNAIIERKGSKTAFITTKGFEDVLEIGRELRYDIYDLFLTMPKPLVPRHLRFGVSERVDNKGNVLTPLQKSDLNLITKEFNNQNIEAVGVCLLNSFANDAHEKQIGEFLSAQFPNISFSLSSEIMPEIREYERSSATAMNAYVQPITDQYLRKLETELIQNGFVGKLLIMNSAGRLTTINGARKSPIQLLESGPAGGSMAGAYFGKQKGLENLLCFDMGGTTAKASLIFKGKPEITNNFEAGRVKRFKKGSGLPVRIPVIDMIEIGAGGGSIARVDNLGLLTVGPDSASSTPGPACYGQGGEFPTVTDADLILGYLNEDYFLGGTMSLDKQAARNAIEKHIAKPLNITIEAAALGVHKIVNENMANAARVHILEKGMDPRHFSMIAFGGAGPVHSFGVGDLLNAPQMIIPVGAGVTSALGFLLSPIAQENIHSYIKNLNDLDWNRVNSFLSDMENEGLQFLENSGESIDSAMTERVVDMRYEGQGHDITIVLPNGNLNELSIPEIEKRFIEEYEFRYNRSITDVPLQMVTWRVLVKGVAAKIPVNQEEFSANGRTARKGNRQLYFESTGYLDCPVYDRYYLNEGFEADGPMIIEEKESTTVIGLNCKVSIDFFKNIIVDYL